MTGSKYNRWNFKRETEAKIHKHDGENGKLPSRNPHEGKKKKGEQENMDRSLFSITHVLKAGSICT